MNSRRLLSTIERLKVDPARLNVEGWKRRVMAVVSECIHADRSVFFSQPKNAPLVQLTRNTMSSNNKAYLKYYYALDPLKYLAGPDSGVKLNHGPKFRNNLVSLEEVVDPASLRTSEYYNDFLRPQKIRHETVVYLKSGKRIMGILSVMRQTAKGFASNEIDFLKLLSPYLTTNLENLTLRQENRMKKKVLDLFEEQSSMGVVILDTSMKVVFSSERATEWLPELTGRNNLATASPIKESCRLLKQKIEASNSGQASVRCRLVANGHSIDTEIRYYRDDSASTKNDFFTIILEPAQNSRLNMEKIQSHFMLTKREVDIIGGIIRGCKNARIAEELFIAENTVKKHIQNICGKLGLKNRTAIIHKILSAYEII